MNDFNIQLIRRDENYVIDSRIVSEGLDIEHKTLKDNISKHRTQFERFGPLTFEPAVANTSGLGFSQSFYLLNENQVLLAGTLSRNTEKVVDFKVALIDVFSKVREQLTAHQPPQQLPDSPIELAAKEMEAIARHEIPQEQAEFLYNSVQEKLADELYYSESRFMTVKQVKQWLKLDERHPGRSSYLSIRIQKILDVLAISKTHTHCCGIARYELTDDHLKLIHAVTLLPDWHARSAKQLAMPFHRLSDCSDFSTQLRMFGAYPEFN